ncbi:hypothetical protein GCM10009087_28740 [Sphingomonas oligophenolica]|uniref:DUF6445 family protein n=1 Tax=Sphingomonas oligophenolica TaxID=301154 RepID=A0ABU9Y8F1_9SPHN
MTATTTNWRLQVERFGNEQQPVVVIDGFAPDPCRFTDDAAFLSFRPIGEHYPGIRAVVAPVMLRDLLQALSPVIADIFGLAPFEVIDAFYSLVTTPASALAPIQRLPHFDGVEDGRLALLHYLSPDPRGGTAFYRHRATGFESIDAARLCTYRAALDADLRRTGLPGPAYIAGDTPLFEQIARFDAVFNRAILYRSTTLHCADIPEDMALSADPSTGRLTVNTFLGPR